VETSSVGAQTGQHASASVTVATRSGTNSLHGNFFEYTRNYLFNGRSATALVRDSLKQNQFGVTGGAPIIKNRLFIFGDYQGTRIASSGGIQGLGFTNSNATIPTAAMKNGDFSSLLGAGATGTDINGAPINFVKGTIYDPLSTVGTAATPVSRTAFPGNKIPANRFDPAFNKLIQLFPSPNQNVITGSQPTGDYFYNTPGSLKNDQGDGRVDYRLSDKDSLFGSLSWGNVSKTLTPPFPGALDNSGFSGTGEIDLGIGSHVLKDRIPVATVEGLYRFAHDFHVVLRHRLFPQPVGFDGRRLVGINRISPMTVMMRPIQKLQKVIATNPAITMIPPSDIPSDIRPIRRLRSVVLLLRHRPRSISRRGARVGCRESARSEDRRVASAPEREPISR
jgi:hypothetical protein